MTDLAAILPMVVAAAAFVLIARAVKRHVDTEDEDE